MLIDIGNFFEASLNYSFIMQLKSIYILHYLKKIVNMGFNSQRSAFISDIILIITNEKKISEWAISIPSKRPIISDPNLNVTI